MDKKNIHIDECLMLLEDMRLRMDFLAATANTCGAAFEDEKSLSILSHESIQGAFYGINKQAEDISNDFDIVIRNLMEHVNIIINNFEIKEDSKPQIDEE